MYLVIANSWLSGVGIPGVPGGAEACSRLSGVAAPAGSSPPLVLAREQNPGFHREETSADSGLISPFLRGTNWRPAGQYII